MDRISNLPDEVLSHTLSFLTTKEAALTSVLSKRWRNLIALVPNLDVDHCDFRQSFMDFLDRVLALQGNAPIKRFYLGGMGCIDSEHVNGWIQNLMVRGVSEIVLSIFDDNLNRMFPNVFQNKKLVKLELRYGFDICLMDESLFLPTLKTLVLKSVSVSVDKFEILLHALPALEELVLCNINWYHWDNTMTVTVTISSASLKALTIESSGRSLSPISFDTPSLVYFCYSGMASKYHFVSRTKNLVEARISMWGTRVETARERLRNVVIIRFSDVGNLMNGIRNIRCLVLSPNTLEELSLCCKSLPVFKNLKSLTIKSNNSRGWQAMPALLRKCPHLETLGVLHNVTDKCGDACDCVSREEKGRSLKSCPVKVLEIKGFKGRTKEMNLIKHFLNYFPCLKEMKIYIEENDPAQLKVTEVSKFMGKIMMEHYNKSSSCNVQLLVSGNLYKKWTTIYK
ncbi:hypothetical protein CARUB_v10007671mg [Capsella rubella]|uniref:F-box domain-containing protein n=1 Tax=Capsella rubella TaxID=81985 RepID=R0H677_9BRAS|nr:putative F-box protein At5g38390 [Capsella rubella]EOA19013.1 hypothetical protein CARUB_v10007671mg [Capsella rubella]